ncbi:LuxR C-terminal-related transcriptional regulator [bacterium]|nr:LuxR C-terminal-related transcriptional regulator [bacterium]
MIFEATTHRQLTPREVTVLSAAKKYKPVSDIASSLHIPQSIVMRHLSNIINKLNESDQQLARQIVYTYNLQVQD